MDNLIESAQDAVDASADSLLTTVGLFVQLYVRGAAGDPDGAVVVTTELVRSMAVQAIDRVIEATERNGARPR